MTTTNEIKFTKRHTAGLYTSFGYEISRGDEKIGWVAQDAAGRWVPWLVWLGIERAAAKRTRAEAVAYMVEKFDRTGDERAAVEREVKARHAAEAAARAAARAA